MGGKMMQDPRPINTNIKTKLINPEKEKPSRWSFLKILREHSDLRLFYPEINPNAEVYKMRDNLYCIYYDGIHCGEMWCYLIDGPQKAMLIDTAFGLGDLKGLIHKLIGDKEIIVCNTHCHIDHVSGNSHFDKRHTRIVITDKGKNLIQETEDIYQDIMNKMKMILSEEEIESCIHSIDKIKELFK